MTRPSKPAARRAPARASAHVALLRAVNLGPTNKIAMHDLVALFSELGCADVSTYILSGNVLFRAGAALARRLPALVEEQLRARFELSVPVVLRSADELEAAVEGNPFLRAGADPATLHVLFLRDEPSAARVATLDPRRSPPDELAVRGRDVYLRLPNGVARSKLTPAYFDKALGTVATGRNWRTTLKLRELLASR